MKLIPRGQPLGLYCAILAAATLISGCASLPDPEQEAKDSATTTPLVTPTATNQSEMTLSSETEPESPQSAPAPAAELDGNALYNAFLAQLAEARQDYQTAALLNFRLARAQRSSVLAEQALSQALQAGDSQLALNAADLLQDINPNNPFGFRAGGLLKLELGEFTQGYQDVQNWLALDPAANTAAIARSADKLNRGQRDQLQQLVAPIAERSTPAAASALLALGLFAELNGATEQVISGYAIRSIDRSPSADAWALRIRHEQGSSLEATLEEALNDFSEDRALHITAIQRLIQLGQADAALTVGANWLRFARSDYELRRYLSSLAVQQESWGLVEELSQPLLSVTQYRDEAWYRISAARYYQDDFIGAKNAAVKIGSQSDYYPAAWEIIAFVELELVDIESAREALQQERERNRDQGDTLYEIEVALLRDANLNELAGATLETALAEYPDSHDLRLQYGYWLMSNTSLEAGIDVLLPLIETEPMSHEAANAIAYSYVELDKNFAEAERLLTYALEIEPDNAAYLDSLGWLFFKQGKLNEALAMLDKALAFSNNPEIIAHKVEVLMQQGKSDEAKAIWQTAWQQRPDNQYLANVADRFGWR